MLWLLLLIGLASGVVTGLLSLGGGIIMIFLLMVVPSALHFPKLPLHQIGDMVNLQSLFSSASASFVYVRNRMYNMGSVVYTGIGACAGAMVGSFAAIGLSNRALTILFACLSTLATVSIFLPHRGKTNAGFLFSGSSIWRWSIQILIGFTIALLGGMLGVTAGFLLVPTFLYLYGYPVKESLGGSVMIGVVIAISSFASRVASGTLPPWSSLVLIIGAISGAYLGASITKRLSPYVVKGLANLAISLVALYSWWNIL